MLRISKLISSKDENVVANEVVEILDNVDKNIDMMDILRKKWVLREKLVIFAQLLQPLKKLILFNLNNLKTKIRHFLIKYKS